MQKVKEKLSSLWRALLDALQDTCVKVAAFTSNAVRTIIKLPSRVVTMCKLYAQRTKENFEYAGGGVPGIFNVIREDLSMLVVIALTVYTSIMNAWTDLEYEIAKSPLLMGIHCYFTTMGACVLLVLAILLCTVPVITLFQKIFWVFMAISAVFNSRISFSLIGSEPIVYTRASDWCNSIAFFPMYGKAVRMEETLFEYINKTSFRAARAQAT
jgi:hypothetical protein